MAEQRPLGCGLFSEEEWAELVAGSGPDAQADAAGRRELLEHVRTCAACRAELAALARLSQQVRHVLAEADATLHGAVREAFVVVIVYVGAVLVMFLFVVMMLDINIAPLREGFTRYLPIGAAVALVMLAQMVMVLSSDHIQLISSEAAPSGVADNTRAIGSVLYTDYLYPFELAGIVLLVAIVAAIMLTLRRRPGVKRQNPAKQVRVRKADRLRVLQIPAESRIVPNAAAQAEDKK